MRNKDTNTLFSLYESKVVKKQPLLTEETPFAELEGLSPEKYKGFKAGEEDVKVMRHPKYGDKPYSQKRLTEEEARNAIYLVGKHILKMFEKFPDKIYPGDRKQFYSEVAVLVMELLKDTSGAPLFSSSWSKHVARNIVDALEEQKVIEYWAEGVRKSKVGKDLAAIVPNIPAPEEIVNAQAKPEETPAPEAPKTEQPKRPKKTPPKKN